MSIAIYVSGDVSGRDVISAQEAIVSSVRSDTKSDIRLIPSDLELGFDVALALNTVSTLTGVASFVYTLISARRRSRGQHQMSDDVDSTDQARRQADRVIKEVAHSGVQLSVQHIANPKEGTDWSLTFNYPEGEDHVVVIHRTGPEDFDASIKQVRND